MSLEERMKVAATLGLDQEYFGDEEVSTGTTIMAIEFKDGVVIGADTRTTTGIYIANRVSNKLTKVTDNIYCCRSGSAADTQAVSDIVAFRLKLYQIETNEEAHVYSAANVFRDICYNYRNQLKAGIIVAGYDKKDGGQVYSVPLGGMVAREPVAIGGSGSGYIWGYVDANYRKDMAEEESVDLVLKSVTLALTRDGSSGGCVRIGVIDKNGCRQKAYLSNELPRFYQG